MSTPTPPSNPDRKNPPATTTPLPDFNTLSLPTEQRTASLSPADFRQIHAGDALCFAQGVAVDPPARHDAEYYAGWRKEMAEKVARGENPYDDFARRAREASDNQPLPRLLRRIGRAFGKGKGRDKDKKDGKKDGGVEGMGVGKEEGEDDGVVR